MTFDLRAIKREKEKRKERAIYISADSRQPQNDTLVATQTPAITGKYKGNKLPKEQGAKQSVSQLKRWLDGQLGSV